MLLHKNAWIDPLHSWELAEIWKSNYFRRTFWSPILVSWSDFDIIIYDGHGWILGRHSTINFGSLFLVLESISIWSLVGRDFLLSSKYFPRFSVTFFVWGWRKIAIKIIPRWFIEQMSSFLVLDVQGSDEGSATVETSGLRSRTRGCIYSQIGDFGFLAFLGVRRINSVIGRCVQYH